MATTPARQALIWLSTVAVLALSVRTVRLHDQRMAAAQLGAAPESASQPELQSQLDAADSAHSADSSHQGRRRRSGRRKAAKPQGAAPDTSFHGYAPHFPPRTTRTETRTSAPIETPIDLDKATEAQIELLPRIGPALAHRIVANRDSLGDFGSLEALESVRGIGPKLAAALAPLVTFSGRPRPKQPRIQ